MGKDRTVRLTAAGKARLEEELRTLRSVRQPALAARIQAAGWADVEWRDLTGGIVALHRARRP